MRAPSCRRASTRSPIGRSCMRATPESRYSPPESARTAVSGRSAVPALPRCSSADLTGKTPPTPCTVAASRSTRTPRRASASSITPVSSESSRSRIFVSPFDSAASSSTRLEMLFDPGIFTVPLARRIGSRSRCFTASLPLFQPAVSRVARSCEQPLQRLAVAALENAAHPLELALVALQLAEQPLAVGEADVPPHLRVAGGDAGEVAEAPRGVSEQALRVLAPGDLVDEREREDVRQVADRGEHRVVLAGFELEHARSAGPPGGAHQRERARLGALDRREHDLPAAVQAGERRVGAALLGSGDGVPGNEARQRGLQLVPGHVDDILLGAAGVGDDGV